jgi:hypothetical protein
MIGAAGLLLSVTAALALMSGCLCRRFRLTSFYAPLRMPGGSLGNTLSRASATQRKPWSIC